MMSQISGRISEFLIDWRWPLFAVALAASMVSYWASGPLVFDRAVENLFTPDDPLLPPYRRLVRTLGGNEVIVAVYDDPELMDPAGTGLARLDSISQRLKQIKSVRDVFSLAELSKTLADIERASLVFGTASKVPVVLSSENEMARRFSELFTGYTHGADGRTAAIICLLVSETKEKVDRRKTIASIRDVMSNLPDGLAPGMLVGEPVMVSDGFRELEIDGQRLGTSSLILLSITVFVCFRSLRWVIAPIVVVQVTLWVTRALVVAIGLRLSMVSSMLTAILTVVGVGTMVLLIIGYRDARRTGLPPREALRLTGELLAGPVFWSIMADVIGFGSLAISRVTPVRDFGTMTAIGSFIVLLAIACLLPVLTLAGRSHKELPKPWGESLIKLGLARLIKAVERYPKSLAFLSIACAAIAAIGATRLEVETDFTKNFRAGSSSLLLMTMSKLTWAELEFGMWSFRLLRH